MRLENKTFRVSEFGTHLRETLRRKVPSVWLTGEVQRLRRSGRGHLYFELVEKGDRDDVVAKLEAVIWRSDLEQIEAALAKQDQRLVEGVEIRCFASADFYPPFGRLQLVVRRIDPDFTAGLLSRRRRDTLKALEVSGLLGRNKELALPEVPLQVILITSVGSAAYHDFVSSLAASGYGFCVSVIHSTVQGLTAEKELVAALADARRLGGDCVVLVRGGGSRTDLAVFDSRSVAESVAKLNLPVVTGLGHEIDESVVDLVANTRTRTPTRAAEFLIDRVRTADHGLARLSEQLVATSRGSLSAARGWLEHAGRELGASRHQVATARERVRGASARLERGAVSRTRSARAQCAAHGAQLRAVSSLRMREEQRRARRVGLEFRRRSRDRIERQKTRLETLGRLARQLSPERTLRRGFSITRVQGGKALRSSDQVRAGSIVETELATGSIVSRVES